MVETFYGKDTCKFLRNLYGMNLSKYETMDPHLLMALVNTELRNNEESLEALVKTHGLDLKKLCEKLSSVGYKYLKQVKQFR